MATFQDGMPRRTLCVPSIGSTTLDAFVELELSIWDAIGALAIVEDAGGFAATFAPSRPTTKAPCLACAPGIGRALTALTGVG